MTKIKSCPCCNRSYSDSSLSFCLEDGWLSSSSFELKENDDEEVTLVRSTGNNKVDSEYLKRHQEFIAKRENLSKKFKKTERTLEEHPILDSVPIFEKPAYKWGSTEYIREITFEITGIHTYHPQENLVILREYLNEFVIEHPDKLIEETTMRLGVANFYTRRRRAFSYDFQRKQNPSKKDFLNSLNSFLNDKYI